MQVQWRKKLKVGHPQKLLGQSGGELQEEQIPTKSPDRSGGMSLNHILDTWVSTHPEIVMVSFANDFGS